MIGQMLGRYRIDADLGKGGMGVVYRAYDTELRRPVAIKVLTDTEGTRERLLQEARAASALNHPNVCTVHEVGQSQDGQPFIVMEYVDGRSLDDLIPPGGLPNDELLKYGVQIASALADAHANGLLHRDLKSANVRVTPDGRVKVLDFGLATRLHDAAANLVTESRAAGDEPARLAGTLAYMSPEVLQGEPADERSDIWALGVLVYEAATGARPFRGRTAFELTSAIQREPVPPLPPHISASVGAIINRCLAKQPGERYQRASEVRAALEVCRADLPAAPAKPRKVMRRRTLVIGAGTLAILAVGVAIAVSWRNSRPTVLRVSTGAPASSNAEANEYFERAMLFLARQFDLERARTMLERSLALDPHFAEARAHYGFTNLLKIDAGYSNDTAWLYKAETELQRALNDDPQSGRAHSAMAGVYMYQARKDLIPGEVDRAVRANPADLDIKIWLANYHQLNGDHEAARQLMTATLKVDPLFFPARMNLGDVLREQGDVAGAIRELLKVLEQDPQLLYGIVFLARAYIDQGDAVSAHRVLEQARPADRSNYWFRLATGLLESVEGQRDTALKTLDDEVLKYALLNPLQTSWVTDAFGALGETEQALTWLERGMRGGDDRVTLYRRDPHLAHLRSHPRFIQILESMERRRADRSEGR
jgi:tetratricopeptide (TPR) repeat protein/predicted Ser/Thr protein kinase